MDRKSIASTKIYGEMERDKAQSWFGYTRSKFITHIDTLYYSVKIVGVWNDHPGALDLLRDLREAKAQAEQDREDKPLYPDDEDLSCLLVRPFFGFRMYRYGISKLDCFDIFVAENVPNVGTSAIVVQLRSQFIWLRGARGAFNESLSCLCSILEKYAIHIADITENRIDYAYHTNYIQNMLSFFRDENLGEMQVSNFKRWGKEGCFNFGGIESDYISLGRRTSNNAFIRIYNKSKEVIEMGYKQFFVPVWQEQGLISAFDRYIFDAVFDSGKTSWNYKDVCRCRFYLEHGCDQDTLDAIRALMEKANAAADDYKLLADSCVPDLTNITNIEIQTKRKFYSSFVMPPIEVPDTIPPYAHRMHIIFESLRSFRDFITHDTIRFVKFKGEYANIRRDRRPTAYWWLRLAACVELDGVSYGLCREYQRKYDIQRSKNRSMSSIAMLSSLLDDQITKFHIGDGLHEDIANLIDCFNDNDLRHYDKVRKQKVREVESRFT